MEFCRLAGVGQVGVIAELVEHVQSEEEEEGQEEVDSQDDNPTTEGNDEPVNGINGTDNNNKRTSKPRRRKAEIQGEKAGGMMRRDACLAFGRKWGLRVCTIEALVEYLDKNEGTVI